MKIFVRICFKTGNIEERKAKIGVFNKMSFFLEKERSMNFIPNRQKS